jgi:hypothetical protein
MALTSYVHNLKEPTSWLDSSTAKEPLLTDNYQKRTSFLQEMHSSFLYSIFVALEK